ncbi:hypothetical protein BGZ70_003705 [Mortierella alpina]|uniref:Uncharacterized protein n=1 Tax=Mortierella alpina TaxID=64518 RepID=A0A9P6JAJ3_MORAP|nr:hypothetical protein BGZ70_003705 [Mortierella alpina]
MRIPPKTFAAIHLCLAVFGCLALSDKSDGPRPDTTLEHTIRLSPDYAIYDSSKFSAPELAATAASPFCRSFMFLCHVRCLQRGDPQDPNNFPTDESSPFSPQDPSMPKRGEINRCTQVPNSKSIRVLCLCNNGVELTAEVSYALEGVVDIKAAGGNGTGIDEAGLIRQVVYKSTKTVHSTIYRTVIQVQPTTATQTVTETVTSTVTITPACTLETSFTSSNEAFVATAASANEPENPTSAAAESQTSAIAEAVDRAVDPVTQTLNDTELEANSLFPGQEDNETINGNQDTPYNPDEVEGPSKV